MDNSSIYVTNADGSGEPRRLTSSTEGAWDSSPAWSPDGSELAFTHIEFGKGSYGDEEIRNTDVYKIDADGSKKTRLPLTYSGEYHEHDAVWSPDGKQLAYIEGYYSGTDSVESNTIYVMKSNGSQRTVVRTEPEGYEMDLDWQ